MDTTWVLETNRVVLRFSPLGRTGRGKKMRIRRKKEKVVLFDLFFDQMIDPNNLK